MVYDQNFIEGAGVVDGIGRGGDSELHHYLCCHPDLQPPCTLNVHLGERNLTSLTVQSNSVLLHVYKCLRSLIRKLCDIFFCTCADNCMKF